MEADSHRRGGWRWGLAAATLVALVALVPQFHLWAVRGPDWNGTFASVHPDEAAYAAYVNALIDGRPRRNDPYSGKDDAPEVAAHESLFSVQLVPAYALALPARLFGLSAAAMFILLGAFVAFAAALALQRLILAATGDARAAAAGALLVLCCGGLARAQPLVKLLGGEHTPYIFLLFLRRYLPAAPFPLLFVFMLCVWRALAAETTRAALLWAAGAGAVFALLVYSYFFFWTATAAWLAVAAALWLAFRARDRRRTLLVSAVVAAFAAAALAPYALLLARRSPTMDAAQGLVLTRAPDLFRPPALIGLCVAAALALAARRGLVRRRSRAALLAVSLSLLPLALFNQQVLTGRSLQPIHYEQFVANYVVVLALAIAATLVWQGWASNVRNVADDEVTVARLVPRRLALAACALALGWGLLEVGIATRRYARFNVPRDEARDAALRLAEIARTDARETRGPRPVVWVRDALAGESFPSVAPQALLWSPGMFAFPGTPRGEERERFFYHFYYSGVDEQRFARLAPHFDFALFGWARAIRGLAAEQAPITDEELRAVVGEYAHFVRTFDRGRAARRALSYVVVYAGEEPLLANLDRWYERDAGEHFGRVVLYRVRLRGP